MYLEPPPDETRSNNIMTMARTGLRQDLPTTLYKDMGTKEIVRCLGLHVKTNGHSTTINLSILPVATNLAVTSKEELATIN